MLAARPRRLLRRESQAHLPPGPTCRVPALARRCPQRIALAGSVRCSVRGGGDALADTVAQGPVHAALVRTAARQQAHAVSHTACAARTQGVLGTVIVNSAGHAVRSTLDVSADASRGRATAPPSPTGTSRCLTRLAWGSFLRAGLADQGVRRAHPQPSRDGAQPGSRPGPPGEAGSAGEKQLLAVQGVLVLLPLAGFVSHASAHPARPAERPRVPAHPVLQARNHGRGE